MAAPNKSLGQHFLKNPSVIKKILAALSPEQGETIVEIGPGHGELTVPLRSLCDAAQCDVIAIEKDLSLARELEARFPKNKILVKEGDALAILPALHLKNYKIVGNIPYYTTGHLLRVVGELAVKPARCVLMIQKEVGERLVAEPPSMNRLAASVQFWAKPSVVTRVSRDEFNPPPKVDSVVMILETFRRTPAREEADYYSALRAIFAQPRKTILNNVKAAFPDLSKDEISTRATEKGVNPLNRPQNLRIADIQALAKAFWG